MKQRTVTKLSDIKNGDSLLIEGDLGGTFGPTINFFKNVQLKKIPNGCTEVICEKRKNIYFNLEMYFE